MRNVLSRLSLRARLLLLTAGLLLAGLALISAVVSANLARYQLDRLDNQLHAFTSLVSSASIAGSPRIADTTEYPELIEPALDLIGAPYLVYLDENGTVTGGVRSTRLDSASLPPSDDLRAIPADGEAVELRAADGSGRWRAVAQPVSSWSGTVIATAPLAQVDATIARLRTTSLVSGAMLLVLLTGAGWFALGHGLRPLRRIEHTAARSPTVTSPSGYPTSPRPILRSGTLRPH